MKGVVFTLGCKVNQYEGQSIVSALKEFGVDASTELEKADLYVINTCSITAEADKKSRQAVARVLKLNPDARVVVLGCSSQNDFKAYQDKGNIIAISGTAGKIESIQDIMSDIVCKNSYTMPDITNNKQGMSDITSKNNNINIINRELPKIYEDDLSPQLTKSRGMIKIQDGCDRFCTYCRVPYLRGRSRSRSQESIIEEAKRLSDDCAEIIITGIDISDYGKDTNTNLIQLINQLGDIKSKEGKTIRKRLGSLECGIISKQLLVAMKDSGFCDHFHLSLQSGSDTVLKRMNRHYTAQEYKDKVDLIRSIFPFAGITTDIIAGFPQESDFEHKKTIEFIKTVEFSDIHVFPYSARKGTNAYKLPQVDSKVKASRASELNQIKQKTKIKFLELNLNRRLEVFTEENKDEKNKIIKYSKNLISGFTSNYIKVYTESKPNVMVEKTLKEIYKDGVYAE